MPLQWTHIKITMDPSNILDNIYLAAPIIFFASFALGIAFYMIVNEWEFNLAYYFASTVLLGNMYLVPTEPNVFSQVFTLFYFLWGTTLLAGAIAATLNEIVTNASRVAAEERHKMISLLDNHSTESDSDRYGFGSDSGRPASTKMLDDHFDRQLYVVRRYVLAWLRSLGISTQYFAPKYLFAIVWILIGMTYGVLYEQWDIAYSFFFAIAAMSASGAFPPECINDPPESDMTLCRIGVFRCYFLGTYILFGVPIFAYTVGQFAEILVKKAVQMNERKLMLRPLNLQEFYYAIDIQRGNVPLHTLYSHDDEYTSSADDCERMPMLAPSQRSASTRRPSITASSVTNTSTAYSDARNTSTENNINIEFDGFIILELLRLKKITKHDLEYMKILFDTLKNPLTNAITLQTGISPVKPSTSSSRRPSMILEESNSVLITYNTLQTIYEDPMLVSESISSRRGEVSVEQQEIGIGLLENEVGNTLKQIRSLGSLNQDEVMKYMDEQSKQQQQPQEQHLWLSKDITKEAAVEEEAVEVTRDSQPFVLPSTSDIIIQPMDETRLQQEALLSTTLTNQLNGSSSRRSRRSSISSTKSFATGDYIPSEPITPRTAAPYKTAAVAVAEEEVEDSLSNKPRSISLSIPYYDTEFSNKSIVSSSSRTNSRTTSNSSSRRRHNTIDIASGGGGSMLSPIQLPSAMTMKRSSTSRINKQQHRNHRYSQQQDQAPSPVEGLTTPIHYPPKHQSRKPSFSLPPAPPPQPPAVTRVPSIRTMIHRTPSSSSVNHNHHNHRWYEDTGEETNTTPNGIIDTSMGSMKQTNSSFFGNLFTGWTSGGGEGVESTGGGDSEDGVAGAVVDGEGVETMEDLSNYYNQLIIPVLQQSLQKKKKEVIAAEEDIPHHLYRSLHHHVHPSSSNNNNSYYYDHHHQKERDEGEEESPRRRDEEEALGGGRRQPGKKTTGQQEKEESLLVNEEEEEESSTKTQSSASRRRVQPSTAAAAATMMKKMSSYGTTNTTTTTAATDGYANMEHLVSTYDDSGAEQRTAAGKVAHPLHRHYHGGYQEEQDHEDEVHQHHLHHNHHGNHGKVRSRSHSDDQNQPASFLQQQQQQQRQGVVEDEQFEHHHHPVDENTPLIYIRGGPLHTAEEEHLKQLYQRKHLS